MSSGAPEKSREKGGDDEMGRKKWNLPNFFAALAFRAIFSAAAIGALSAPLRAEELPRAVPAPQWAAAICDAAIPIEQKAYAARMADSSAQSARDLIPAAVERLRSQSPELFELPGWPGAIGDFYRQRAQSWERYSPTMLQSIRDKFLLATPGLFERIATNQCLKAPFIKATRVRVEEATRFLDAPARGVRPKQGS